MIVDKRIKIFFLLIMLLNQPKLISSNVNIRIIFQINITDDASNGIESISWHPDGVLLASNSISNPIKIWNTNSGHLATYPSLINRTNSPEYIVEWGTFGKFIAFDTMARMSPPPAQFYLETNITIFDISQNSVYKKLYHPNRVFDVKWMGSADKIVTMTNDQVSVWDIIHEQEIFKFSTVGSSFRKLSWLPSKDLLAVGLNNGTIIILDSDLHHIKMLNPPSEFFSTTREIEFPDLNWINSTTLVSTFGELIFVWDLLSEEISRIIHGHQATITSLSFNPRYSLLASGSIDNSVIIWDFNSGKPLINITDHLKSVSDVLWYSEGNKLATSSSDRNIFIYKIDFDYLKYTKNYFVVNWRMLIPIFLIAILLFLYYKWRKQRKTSSHATYPSNKK